MLSALAADRARIAEFDAQISLLERQKAEVQARLNSYRYPVCTLPNEIITEIFGHFLPRYPEVVTFHKFFGPIALTQTCRRWREIALQTPALWRAIDIYPLAEHPGLFDAWLSRARGRPISILFNTDWVEQDRAAGSLTAIIPYRAQLEYLELHRGSLSQLQAIEGPMPMLRHFQLLLQEEDDPPTVAFKDAPLLQKVLLDGAAVGNIKMPWFQLTSLALYAIFPDDCARILQQTFNLVHCELSFVAEFRDEDAIYATLPSLRTLTMTHLVKDRPMAGFLQTLTVPVLHSLRVPESYLEPSPIDTLKSLISKSGCNLQELCLTGTTSGSNSSYHTAFPSTKVSFADFSTSFVNKWLTFS
ncbi:hypothetical protein C8R45DRAFT_583318 [Mycena sanguinolenta]|nr:hypothetical protein C8R45DRAFT_583318 [Mycena sanguinolenta]